MRRWHAAPPAATAPAVTVTDVWHRRDSDRGDRSERRDSRDLARS